MPVNIFDKSAILKIEDTLRSLSDSDKDKMSAYIAYACTRVDDIDEAISLAQDAMIEDR